MLTLEGCHIRQKMSYRLSDCLLALEEDIFQCVGALE